MKNKISIIGLGYVGLPLALEFSKKYPTVGFDISLNRVKKLKNYIDDTFEVDSIDLKDNIIGFDGEFEINNRGLLVSNKSDAIKDSNIYIITVPTPVDNNNQPLLKPIISATQTVGNYLKKGDLVIYESTVYPGLTEEICVPELEKTSKLLEKASKDYKKVYVINISPTNTDTEVHSPGLTKNIKIYNEILKQTVNALRAKSVYLIDINKYISERFEKIDEYILKEDGHHITPLTNSVIAKMIIEIELGNMVTQFGK